jgi:hypothetical protein
METLTSEYTQAGHVNRFTITKGRAGWDVRQERDDTVVKRVNYMDWHRVERAIHVFELEKLRAEENPHSTNR